MQNEDHSYRTTHCWHWIPCIVANYCNAVFWLLAHSKNILPSGDGTDTHLFSLVYVSSNETAFMWKRESYESLIINFTSTSRICEYRLWHNCAFTYTSVCVFSGQNTTGGEVRTGGRCESVSFLVTWSRQSPACPPMTSADRLSTRSSTLDTETQTLTGAGGMQTA